MKPRSIAPFSALLLLGALAACPAFAQATGPDPSTKAGAKTEKPTGAGTNAGVTIAHGPGVIDHDTADARERMYGTTPTTGPAASSDNMTIATRQGGWSDRGYGETGWTAGPATASVDTAAGYGPSSDYAYQPGYGDRCFQRRVMINQRHWEWRLFCE